MLSKRQRKNWKKSWVSCLCCAVLLSTTSGICAAEDQSASENQNNSLDEVVVTATRTAKPVKEVTSSISVITQEMIQHSAAQSITQLLMTQPGVAINGYQGPGRPGAISLRGLNGGGGSSKVLVMMDGRPLNFMGSGAVIDWDTIPLENIERIEIVRGPSSALYGGNGLSGAINIITKKPDGKDHTYLNTSYGTWRTSKTTFIQEGKSGDTNYMITGDYKKSDGFIPSTDYEGHDFTLRMDMANGVTLRSGYTDNNYSNSNTKHTDAKGKTFYSDDRNKVNTYYFDLEKKFSSDRADTTIRAYYSYYNPVVTVPNYPTYSDWEDSMQGLALQQDIKLGKQHTFTWGSEFQNIKANDLKDLTAANIGRHGYNTYAFFAQDDRHLTDKWLMNLGGRYDHNNQYGSQFSPKFGFAYAATKDTTYKINIAKAFKAPSLSDLISNPNLNPTTEWSYEFGVDKQFNSRTTGSIVFYKMDTKNNIIKGANTNATNCNMHPKGVEISLDRKINDHVSFYTNYTYLDDGKLTFYASRHKANGGIYYSNKALSIDLSENYVGSTWDGDQIYTQAKSGHKVGDPADVNLLDPYLLTNLKITYAPTATYSYSVGFENLFNRKYSTWSNGVAPGRSITWSVHMKF